MSQQENTANSDTDINSAASRPASSLGRYVWLIALVLIGVFVFQAIVPSGGAGSSSIAVGKPAPSIDLIGLSDGEEIDGGVERSVTLLHFWGTWCGPCRMEYPHLSETIGELSGTPGFRFLPVSCESGSGETLAGLAEKTFDYFQNENITSPALADPRGVTRTSAAERLEQPSLYYPTSILIGSDGKIAGVWEGYTPEAVDQIAAMTQKLLDQIN